MTDPPIVKRHARGVFVWTPEQVANFTGIRVRTRPWPPTSAMRDLLLYAMDGLTDRGVSPSHPFLVPCTACGAGWAEACIGKRSGKPVKTWHRSRRW